MIRITISDADGERSSQFINRSAVRIGRDPGNDVVVHDRYVSGRHGEIRVTPNGLSYEDFATTNGSRVRRGPEVIPVDAKVDHRMDLMEGDQLLLGDAANFVTVSFEYSEARVFSPRSGVLGARRLAHSGGEVDATHAETLVLIPGSLDREILLALHRLTARLAGGASEADMLRGLSEGILEAMPRVNHVSAWLIEQGSGQFRPSAALSRRGPAPAVPVSRAVRDRVLARGKALVFETHQEGFDGSESLHDASVRAGMVAPLWDGRNIMGLVQADCRGVPTSGRFGATDLEALVVFAHQAALAIANARLHENLRRSVEQAITGLVAALEAKDSYTAGHSAAVADLCVATCEALVLPTDLARTMRRAALLHDIGKIGIPYGVLNKQDPLTTDEFRVLKSHPELGARILQPFDFLGDLVPIVLHHHERWDGRGYPAGLSGESIPLGARILAVADTWHSLVSDRAYRSGVGADVAVKELRRCAGTQLDPRLVEAFLGVVAPGHARAELEDATLLAR